MGSVLYLDDEKKSRALDAAVDIVVEDWIGSLAFKVCEIDEKYGRSAAYQFYARVTNHDMYFTRKIVDMYVENKEALDI